MRAKPTALDEHLASTTLAWGMYALSVRRGQAPVPADQSTLDYLIAFEERAGRDFALIWQATVRRSAGYV